MILKVFSHLVVTVILWAQPGGSARASHGQQNLESFAVLNLAVLKGSLATLVVCFQF